QWPQPIPDYGPPPIPRRPRRRGRLVLVLIVLIVLLISLVGFVLKYRATHTSSTGSAPATRTMAPEVPAGGAGRNVVPTAYLGTWSGQAVFSNYAPAGAVTLTVGPGGIGDESAASRLDSGTTRCEAAWTLVEVTSASLVYTSRRVRSTPGACADVDLTERRVLVLQLDGTIQYGVSRSNVITLAALMRRIG
ncbi:hypothetical protein AB0O00_37415, partial [Kitasatospora sp. NPDC093558]